ncbi:MAG: 5-formyltetrahydrofolate cyclo-ligase [Peptococcaceae bacterium]|nr:5-formyltetrahydrofolate cyclo-ligase [Peptococcaceae bacterium]
MTPEKKKEQKKPKEQIKPPELAAEKQRLRRQLLDLAKSLDARGREDSDKRILSRLADWQEYRRAKSLFLYVGLGWEIHTRPLILQALGAGKRIALPLCREKGRMEARWVTSLAQLKPSAGPLKLLEPSPECALALPEELGLLILPCLSCDFTGRRLGRGGGYYDRYLAAARESGAPFITAALCRELLLRPELPAGSHDQSVDFVVWEKGIADCR